MKAKYYRYLFHRVTDGLCYSGSISNQMGEKREDFCFLYLAGGDDGQESGTSYAEPENTYDLVILADLAPAAVKRACKVIRNCSPKEILMPDGAKDTIRPILQMLTAAGASTIRTVKEEKILHKCREYFQIVPVNHGEKRSLMLYHADEKGMPDTEECIISVKSTAEGMLCPSRADHEKLACEMRCMLYQDFMLCKKHNQKNQKQFVDGHLLFALAENQEKEGGNRAALYELARQHREKLRILGFAEKNLTSWDVKRLGTAGAAGFARYVAGPADTAAKAIKEIATGEPNRYFFPFGEQSGLCISGYYVPRNAIH